MAIFSFCLGILIGGCLGAIGMFLLVKETRLDLNIEDESIDPITEKKNEVPDLMDVKNLDEIMNDESEVKYGNF